MEVDIKDKKIVLAVLNGLSSRYEYLIVALDAIRSDEKRFFWCR